MIVPSSNPAPARRSFSRSIRYRLLLVVVATAVSVVAIHDLAAYREVRRTALSLATEQLTGLATRLGDMLQAQGTQYRQQATAAARDLTVQSFVASSGSNGLRDSVGAILLRSGAPAATGAELWNAERRQVASAGDVPAPDSVYERELIARVASEPAAIGPLYVSGDSLLYAAIARVATGSANRGYVVQWHRVARNVNGRQPILSFIGPDAGVYVGNALGQGWTDFSQTVARPPIPATPNGITSYERGRRGRQLAAARAIPGTPWMVVVESAERRALEPIYAMMRRLALTTAMMLALALAVAWLFGTRLTTPLGELATAVSGISTGDYSRRVTPRGRDEVGTLATAFNTMADSIQTAHHALEERSEQLSERAGQLAVQATQLETSNAKLTQAAEEAVRARDELSVVSAELDAALASAPVGFAFHDETGRYKRVNSSLARLNGASIEAHVGKLPSEVSPGIGSQLEKHLRRAVSTASGVFDVELSDEVPGRQGQTRYWLVSAFPIRTADGHGLGVGSVVTDLTLYKQLEWQLLHAQKMEAVGRLAGGVAHDFNNMLTAVSGFGQFVLAELATSGSETARRDMEEVLSAAERAAALTRQLLAFSRQQVLQPRVLDLNAVVAGLTPMLARLIGTDIRLQTMRQPKIGAVKADPSQVEQVIANLVLNARDAMPNGGSVVIETADVELDAAYASEHEGVSAGPYVMLAVSDSGVGMDAATRARAFDPFFTTKEPGRGTGLGLSTVYGIVKQSGGNIEVYSELGHGTAFKVYLPRCDERAELDTPARSLPAVPNGQATLLVVDDDPQVLAATKRALQRAGYVVLSASNGREALDIARAHARPVDLIITDLVMPEMGGRELARHLAKEQPEARLLFTSGYTAEAMNQTAILEPGAVFLGKPFTPDGLLRTVYRILNPDA